MINSVSFLVWNVRGISSRDTQRFLNKLLVDNSIRLLVLIEPMTDVAQLDAICRILHFPYAKSFLEGEIWIFWLDYLSLSF